MAEPITVEIVSDFACPWCLVGKRRFEKALAQLPDLSIVVKWRPFQLNPTMPREGRNRRDYYLKKFDPDHLDAMRAHLYAAGAEDGIVFCDAPDAMAPNTLSAHVLMYWAEADPNIDTNAVAEKLFNAHHVACENIGDLEVLVRIGHETGMDEQTVRTKLLAGEDESPVEAQIEFASRQGISGVPFFIINNRYGLSGAQPADHLASAILKASSE